MPLGEEVRNAETFGTVANAAFFNFSYANVFPQLLTIWERNVSEMFSFL